MKQITVKTPKGTRKIGPGHPAFIIAEMSGNHNHDIRRAYRIIDAAARAGVDAIKLQTYTPDTITMDCDKKYFKITTKGEWQGKTLYELYKSVYTPWEWQPKLKKYAESKGIMAFSTPFDETAVDFLEKMEVSIHKIASFELTDTALLKKIGATGKPVIISRGMATIDEIKTALKTLKASGASQIVVLHCVSAAPVAPDRMNLSTIPDIAKRFNVVSGLSDHSLGVTIPIAAVALGASIIEKHFTLSRSDGGADAGFSAEPEEMKAIVKAAREVEAAIGRPTYDRDKEESRTSFYRRSLFVTEDIKKGEEFSKHNVRSIRPGQGLATGYLDKVIGKKAAKNIKRGMPLNFSHIKK